MGVPLASTQACARKGRSVNPVHHVTDRRDMRHAARCGERPKQTTLLASASAAYRAYGIAVTFRHAGVGRRISFGPRFKPAAELSDLLSFHPSSDNDGNQRYQAVMKVDVCDRFRL